MNLGSFKPHYGNIKTNGRVVNVTIENGLKGE